MICAPTTDNATCCLTPAFCSAARRFVVVVVKKCITGSSSNNGESATSTRTSAPATALARPSPVSESTPDRREAVITSCPCAQSLVATFEPISPRPPMTTIFTMNLSELSLTGYFVGTLRTDVVRTAAAASSSSADIARAGRLASRCRLSLQALLSAFFHSQWPRTSIGLVAAGHEAAVDVENRAGDPAGLVGEQIGDGVGDVGGGADSSQWMKRRESVKRGVDLVLRDPPLESGGLDGGRCHRVDADLVPGKLDGQVMGERMQPGFLHRVPRRRGQTDRLMCPHAADIDDGAALPAGDHARNDDLRQEEQGIVEFHVRVVVLRVVLEKRLRDEESGCVYQQCRVAVLLGKRALHIRDCSAI